MAEFSSSTGGGAIGSNITIRNSSTNSVNNIAELRLKTAHGVARIFKYNTSETVFMSHHGGASDLIMQADGASNFKVNTNGAERLRINGTGATLTGSLQASAAGGVTLKAGSTNAGGAAVYLDGDSDGDWSGATFAHITHDTSGHLNIMSRNPAGNAHIIFGTNDYNAFRVDENRHIRPESENARDL